LLSDRSEASGETPQSSVDLVVGQILRGLYEGRFAPGQKLVESDLAQRFSVGRGSVREALRRLEADGLVVAVLNRGASIRAFNRESARDLIEVMEFLSGMAARLAAERVKPQQAQSLRRCVEALASQIKLGDFYAISRARWEFYSTVAKIADNEELRRLLVRNELSVIRTQFRAAFDLEHEREDLPTYKLVAELVLAGDGAGADRAIRKIIRHANNAVQGLDDEHFAIDLQ